MVFHVETSLLDNVPAEVIVDVAEFL